MANSCYFEARINGKKENVDKLVDLFINKGFGRVYTYGLSLYDYDDSLEDYYEYYIDVSDEDLLEEIVDDINAQIKNDEDFRKAFKKTYPDFNISSGVTKEFIIENRKNGTDDFCVGGFLEWDL